MDRHIQKIGFSNLIVLLLCGAASTGVAFYSNALSARVALVFVALGLLATVVSYLQIRLEGREALEALELQEMAKSARDSALFTSTDSEVFPARRTREQFDRFVLPIFTGILLILQGVATWLLWGWLDRSYLPTIQQPLLTMALLALFGLILFLMGKYAAGLARLEKQRLLRPGASYLLLIAYIMFIVVATIAAAHAGFERFDLYTSRVLVALLGLITLENLINTVLEIYRPRTSGVEARLIYESRLVGFLAQPQGLITTVAQALDYQFGFKVSETWFYRFLERSLGWLILAQAGLLFLSTAVVFLKPTEQALLERFGAPVEGRAVLESGPHLKWPWPIDRVHRYDTTRIRSFRVGVPEEGTSVPGQQAAHTEPETVVWTRAHHLDDFHMMVASRRSGDAAKNGEGDAKSEDPGEESDQNVPPVNLVDVSIPIQFKIADLRKWAYSHTNPHGLLRDLATREIMQYLVSQDFMEVMTSGKAKAGETLRKEVEEIAQAHNLGVEILHVGIQNIHPPAAVARTYERYMGATLDKEAARLRAEGESLSTNAIAQARAAEVIHEAEAYAARTEAEATAEANQFTNQLTAFGASPSVFATRSYLHSLETGLDKTKKIIMGATNTSEVIQFNLEEDIREDLLQGVTVPQEQ